MMLFNETSASFFPPDSNAVAVIAEAILWTLALMSLGGAVLCGAIRLLARRTVSVESRDKQEVARSGDATRYQAAYERHVPVILPPRARAAAADAAR